MVSSFLAEKIIVKSASLIILFNNLNLWKMSVDSVPDSLWLKILGYLDPLELSKVGKVSRRWYLLSRDKSLWRRLDVTGNRITVKKLGVFIRKPMAAHMVSLRIEGGLQKVAPKSARSTLTPALLAEIQEKCTNLRELHVVHAAIENVALHDFPRTLTFISLHDSEISFHFFEELRDNRILPNLTGLDMSNSHNFSSFSRSVPGLLSRTTITELNLKKCFKISKTHLCEIPCKLEGLKSLNVAYLSNIDDDFLYHVAEHSRQLTHLDLSFCRCVSDSGIQVLARSGIPLEKLMLTENVSVSDKCLPNLCEVVSLKFLGLVKTSCSRAGVGELEKRMPYCNVEHVWSEAVSKVGETFWFVPVKD